MSAPIRFENFELDVRGYALRRGGQAIKLERIPMELLILLAENPGKLLLRNEIADRIWGKNHYLSDESAINTAVRKLRAALADDAERPRFIETVTGKGYRFIAALEPAPQRPEASHGPPLRMIVAILPFENLSPQLEPHLSEGVMEQLVMSLGRIAPERLGVIGRTSAMECRRRGLTIREIGHELGADLVIEGSAVREPQAARINVRLLQVADQTQLWAKSYRHDPGGLMAAEDIAEEILRELADSAPVTRAHAVSRVRRPNPEAYEYYLRGRRLWDKKTPGAYAEAIPLFQQAIDCDPTYALPYVGLADTWILMGIHGLAPSPETYPRARAAASRALELDADLAEAHVALAEVSKGYDWNWAQAESGYRAGLRLNSSSAVGRQWFANLLSIVDRHGEAISEVEEARRIDPLSASIAGFVGFTYFRARRYPEALREAEKALTIDPRLPIVKWFLGQIHVQLGGFERAREMLANAAKESNGGAMYVATLGYACGRAGDKVSAAEALQQVESNARDKYVSPLDLSIASLGAGERDRALSYLERAADERVMRVTELNMPTFDELRAEPRFAKVSERLGLPA